MALVDLLQANPVATAVVVGASIIVLFKLFGGGKKMGAKQAKDPNVALDPEETLMLPLVERIEITHNTRLYRFGLPRPEMRLGLPVGKHVRLTAKIDDKEVSRAYTPTTGDETLGHFDLVIKVYPQGAMSRYVDSLKVGDKIAVKGPSGRFQFSRNMKRHMTMIAGGTGVTPMYQVAKAILSDPEDKTTINLIFANVTEGDILIRKELEELASKHPKRFSLYHVLNEAPAGWTGGVGFVSEQIIREKSPAPADDVLVLLCGPLPMNKAMKAHLEAIGHKPENTFVF
eukprot:tig00001408_g8604.t1